MNDLVRRAYRFEDKEAARDVFTRLTGLFRNLNYAPRESDDYSEHRTRIRELADRYGGPSVSRISEPPPASGERSG
jgi:hypothetical protein